MDAVEGYVITTGTQGLQRNYDAYEVRLVEGLPVAVTRLTTTPADGRGACLDVTNHP
jgi:hypothetical protein